MSYRELPDCLKLIVVVFAGDEILNMDQEIILFDKNDFWTFFFDPIGRFEFYPPNDINIRYEYWDNSDSAELEESDYSETA